MNGFPFTNFHNLNLDWIIEKLRKAVFTVNGQGPDDNGNINLSGVAGVTSVNNVGPDSTGNVTLTPANIGAMPDSYQAPVASVNGQTGAVSLSAASVGAMPANYQPPVVSVNAKTGVVVLDATDVGALPDDYTAPVASVNGQTGAVSLDAADVNALPDTTVIPDRTSQLINDSGFITSQQAAAVTSVNGMIGAVVLDADDVGALPDTTVVPTLTSQLVNDSGYITSAQAAPVQSVNNKVGNVVLDASDVGAVPVSQIGYNALYNGPKMGQGDTITLQDDYTNYDFLIITWRTNVDWFCQMIDVTAIQPSASGNSYYTWFGASQATNGLQSVAYIQFPAVNQLNVTNVSYNNSGWALGIVRVVGIRLH